MPPRPPVLNLALFQRLIVDGYNLLHAAGLSQARYRPGDLQRQRHKLLTRLAGLLNDRERRHCTVAFDAFEAPPGLDRRASHGELTILFAAPGSDADALIESLVESAPDPSHLLVISSDNRVQQAARRGRATACTSEEFLEVVQRRHDAATSGPTGASPGKTTGQSDVDYWERQFGAINPAELETLEESLSMDPHGQDLAEFQRLLDDPADRDQWLNGPDRRRK